MTGFPRSTPLIGRSAELGRVGDLFESGHRLITLLGPPGIGKTRLAVCAAEQHSLRRRAWFCDLSNQRDYEELCRQLLATLAEPGRPHTAVAEVLASLGSALLVLDNFEQLVESAPTLEQWLADAPALALLVTTRERLATESESVVELRPLSLPQSPVTRQSVLESEAVQLFLERGAASGATTDEDLTSVAEIVRQLDGIPLAIELAAARTRVLSSEALARHLAEGRALLSLSKRTPTRHRTLADAIAWSWKLLTLQERHALAACSVFTGCFGVDAVERVLTALPVSETSALEILAALRDKSLIHRGPGDSLDMYASVRQFARERLETEFAEAETQTRAAHARHFADLAQRFVRSRLLLTPAGTLQPDVRLYSDNLAAALTFLESAGAVTILPAEERWRLRVELHAALAFLPALAAERSEHALKELLAVAPQAASSQHATAYLALHHATAARGLYDEALSWSSRLLDDEQTPADVKASALLRVGILQREHGRPRDAVLSHERATTLLQGEASQLAAVHLACLGRLHGDLRNFEEARRLDVEAEARCERLGERWLSALASSNLAQLEQERERFDRAEALLERAIARFRDAGELQYESLYAAICGGLYLEWGKQDLARRWYALGERPLELVPPGIPQVLLYGGRAVLEAEAGNARDALEQLQRAERSLGHRPSATGSVLLALLRASVELSTPTLAAQAREDARRRYDAATRPVGDDADATVAMNNTDTRFALRLLQRALQRSEERQPALRVAREGISFVLRDGDRVDLSRRASLRRLLAALARAQIEHPAAVLSVDDLLSAGWPGQRVQPEAAATRVRVAIATLRKLGLQELLLTRDGGYLLDPDEPLHIDE